MTQSIIDPADPETASSRPFSSPGWAVFGGFISTLMLDAAIVAAVATLNTGGVFETVILWLGLLFGVAQWLWILPCVVYLGQKGHDNFKRGMVISASMITLLNAACWGIIAAVK